MGNDKIHDALDALKHKVQEVTGRVQTEGGKLADQDGHAIEKVKDDVQHAAAEAKADAKKCRERL